MTVLNRGEKVSKHVRINSVDLLRFANRGTSGRSYLALVDAIDRLAGTRISTNIRSDDGTEKYSNFGLINAATIERKYGLDGRMMSCDIELSDWVFNSIRKDGVLTLHPDYFELSKPIERRVYELARKHCGQKHTSEMYVKTLFKKSGSNSEIKEFRRAIREISQKNNLPDYAVIYDDVDDKVTFYNRNTMPLDREESAKEWEGHISGTTFEKIAELRLDIDKYAVEKEFRAWLGSNGIVPKNPDALFLDFAKKRKSRANRNHT